MINHIAKSLFFFLLSTSISGAVNAAETELAFKVGGTYSDNITRRTSNTIDETVGVIGLSFIAKESSAKLQFDINADLEFLKYVDNTYKSEELSTLFAFASYDFIPDRFKWVFQDQYGRTIADPFEANTPTNRETINTFSTGPELEFPLGRRALVRLQGRYALNDFETSDVDNNVRSGTISLIRKTSPTRTISLNANGSRFEFDNQQANSSFDRQSVFLGFQSRLARSEVSLNVGANQIHDNGSSQSGLLADVSVVRELTGSSSFTARFNQRYAEGGELFSLYQGSGRIFNRTNDISAVGEPLENQRFELLYDFSRNDNSTYVGISWNDDDFEYSNVYDRKRTAISAGFSKSLRQNWRVAVDASFQKHEFQNTRSSYDETITGVGVYRRLTGKMNLSAGYQRVRREGDGAILGYSENRFSFFIHYRPKASN